ncbi:MAG: 50S ribosomal protein L7Ae [Candidatus Aenigmatarchaeota archaeon]
MDEKKVLDIIEAARETGKIRKGVNEATKSIERGEAKLVVAATDVNPPEIVMHLPLICDEKKIPFAKVSKKLDLGRAAGIAVGTSAIAIADAGEAKNDLKKLLEAKE